MRRRLSAADEEDFAESNLPRPPLVLDFALITRRIAAQQSRFIVLGSEPNWLYEEFKTTDSTIRLITIASGSRVASFCESACLVVAASPPC